MPVKKTDAGRIVRRVSASGNLSQHAEQGTAGSGRLTRRMLLARIADEPMQLLGIRMRVQRQPPGERLVVPQQLVPPVFQGMEGGPGGVRFTPDFRQLGGDGRRVHCPHELADALHLAAHGAMAGKTSGLQDRAAQGVRQVHPFQALRRQPHELATQVLQGAGLALALALAGRGPTLGILVLHGAEAMTKGLV